MELASAATFHAGDDVLVCGPYSVIARLVELLPTAKFRANPNKQAFGCVNGEFLRVAHTKGCCYGYCARAVSAAVSGNWVNLLRLDMREYIASIVSTSWTLRMRSGRDISGIFDEMLRRRVGKAAEAVKLACRGEASILGSPVWNPGAKAVRVYSCRFPVEGKEELPSFGKTYATDEYMTRHMPVKEILATLGSLSMLKVAMAEATFTRAAAKQKKIELYHDVRPVFNKGYSVVKMVQRTVPTAIGRVADMLLNRQGATVARKFLVLCGLDQNTADGYFLTPEQSVCSVNRPTAFHFCASDAYSDACVMQIETQYDQYL
jgi:hypothetical protein